MTITADPLAAAASNQTRRNKKKSKNESTEDGASVKRVRRCTPAAMLLSLALVSAALVAVQIGTEQKLFVHHAAKRQQDRHRAIFLAHKPKSTVEGRRSEDLRGKTISKNHSALEDGVGMVGSGSSPSGPAYHTVFSTSCTDQQHWESMVFFYHAYKVQQPGTVTRIVSGCDAQQMAEQMQFFERSIRPMAPLRFFIHFTPDFADVQKAHGNSYKYMNKPFGLKHWMEHGAQLNMSSVSPDRKKALEDDIVILMDPDMILLRPLTHDFSDAENHQWVLHTNDKDDKPLTRTVRHGHPMAQQDCYLGNDWMDLDHKHIVGTDDLPNFTLPRKADGPIHWNTGPPYLATVRDMYQIAVKWADYAPRVVQIHPELFAEMYGFIYATVKLGLPFTLIRSIVVSHTPTMNREGWSFIDDLPDEEICDAPVTTKKKLPIVLHYCQRYLYGPMFFSKYRLKKNIMNCNKRLLEPPPQTFVGQYNYSMRPPLADLSDKDTYKGTKEPIRSAKIARREAFMLCSLTQSVNEALEHHKQVSCPEGTANLEKSYTVYNDPTNY